MRKLFLLMVILSSVVCVSAEEKASERFERVVNRMVEAINKKDYAGTGKDFDQSMEDFFPLVKRTPFFKNLAILKSSICITMFLIRDLLSIFLV